MTDFHLIQSDLTWENIDVNLKHLERQISSIHSGAIILPEMFSTGFSMNSAKLAESMMGKTVTWLKEQARLKQVCICGSIIIEENGRYFNRFLWVSPNGVVTAYDKRHLFRMAGEHNHYSAGSDRVQLRINDIQLRPQVCYDLRFPAWSRNTTGYDVLLYVANWPAARRAHWMTLLQARAIENLAYVIAVNRVGKDGNELVYAGDSCVIDPWGNYLLKMDAEEGIGSVKLDLGSLREYREAFPAHLDADVLEIKT
jgi:omega-amidase|tara:strand:- start:48 stop:812 length:765 start_codon:yes stop_codon:yes gene_type:complete